MILTVSAPILQNVYLESMIYNPQPILNGTITLSAEGEEDFTQTKFDVEIILTAGKINNYNKTITKTNLSVDEVNQIQFECCPSSLDWKATTSLTYGVSHTVNLYDYESKKLLQSAGGGGTQFSILRCYDAQGRIEIQPNRHIGQKKIGAVTFNNKILLSRTNKIMEDGNLFSSLDYKEYIIPQYNLKEYILTLEDWRTNTKATFICPGLRLSDYSYLIKGNQKLPIKFNEKVSGFKYNYADSATSTLGSKYPFIRRNGQQSHITFTIEGLISYEADDLSEFCNIKDNPVIDEYSNNILKEKQYRQAVIDFLHSGETMIFSSPTEGNIIVRLSNVSLTPNETLDRKVWTFSAQATQVAESTFSNLERYGQELELDGQYLEEYKETGEVSYGIELD